MPWSYFSDRGLSPKTSVQETYSKYGLNLCCCPSVPGNQRLLVLNQILLVLGPTTNQNLEYIFWMRVQGLSPQTDERTQDLQPTLFLLKLLLNLSYVVTFITLFTCRHMRHTAYPSDLYDHLLWEKFCCVSDLKYEERWIRSKADGTHFTI